ncbi:hydrolase [Peribacillus asahii]|uniref:hydrolase n=1 Tax=Peribacillus asahii TaxID=228899 RepID=UPI00380F6368
MEQRTFQIDDQWCMIHYAEQPSGFAVLIIGDRGHFVEQGSSFWLQHPGRLRILEHLKGYGYTLFSSNFYGANWGSIKSVELATKLYDKFMKSEIANDKIHILAEGTGALVAFELMKKLGSKIRSVVLKNPCLSLKWQLEKEKENKLFYKKVLYEVAEAFEIDYTESESFINNSEAMPSLTDTPVQIIHVLNSFQKGQAALYRRLQRYNKNVQLAYLLPEKRYKIPYIINKFYKEHETYL